jgi:hypothetical protein
MARRKGLSLSQGVMGDRAAVDGLYQRESGRVFAYCYARLGSRSLAEWAVAATFDRARDQAADGGLPDHELDWLLRTADKFCSPRLKLGADELAADGALVLGDWNGASFDQIAADLDAHRARLEAARQELSPWRRLLGALGIAPGGGWLQSALGSATAIKATAAVVAVTGAVVVVGTPVGDKLHTAVVPSAKHDVPAVTPAEVVASPGSSARRTASTPQGRPASASSSTPRGPKQPKPGGPDPSTAGSAGTPQPTSGSGGEPATTSSGVSRAASVHTTPTPRPSPATATAPGVTVPQVSTPSVTTAPKPPVAAPTVSTPTAPVPTVSTPTVSTPTVPTPTVSTPTATAPTVTAPTVTATVPGTPGTPTVTVTTPKLP